MATSSPPTAGRGLVPALAIMLGANIARR